MKCNPFRNPSWVDRNDKWNGAVNDLEKLIEDTKKIPSFQGGPRRYYYPDYLIEAAKEYFRDRPSVIVADHYGNEWRCGKQIKSNFKDIV